MRRVLLLTAVLPLAASVLRAQESSRPHRAGLWAELAFGSGLARVACSSCTEAVSSHGHTLHFRMGGTVSDHAFIGAEVYALLDNAFDFSLHAPGTSETATAMVVVLWYPGKSGLFFKGGVGAAFGQYAVPSSPTTADTASGAGMGLTFGAGWDLPISRKLAITANVATYVTGVGDIVLTGRRVDDVIATMYQASIGLTLR